jgi:hypothetical protein
MSLQDRIDAANSLLALTRDLTPSEISTVQIGASASFFKSAISGFSAIVQNNPALAQEIVADFQADPSYQALMGLLSQ